MAMPNDFPPPRNSSSDLPRRRQEISALIARLLHHYWTGDDDPALRRAQADDWIADLVEFDVGDVQNACVEWRRAQHRRPTPSDIRLLAIAEQRTRQARAELRALPSPRQATRKKVLSPWEPGYSKRYEEPWFQQLDYETQQRYMAQDQARLEMHYKVIDGQATEEEFAALCVQQAQDNLGRRPKAKREAKMTPAEIDACRDAAAAADAEAAKKRRPLPRHEDPEQLRLGRIELGLE